MRMVELIRRGEKQLVDAGVPDASVDARLLFEYVSGMTRTELLLHGAEEPEDGLVERYQELISRRSAHVPLQYLTKEGWFLGRCFYVDSRVLIPRQETELLVLSALELMETKTGDLLDLCTGSGCIPISLKLERPGWNVSGLDVSEDALDVARRNARALQADVAFYQSDLFAELPEGRYDVITSNPPYVESEEIEGLMEEVRLFEPRLALDGGADGLMFYKRILACCRERLREGGSVVFEIGCNQGTDVTELVKKAGFSQVTLVKDLSGLDRIVIGGSFHV